MMTVLSSQLLFMSCLILLSVILFSIISFFFVGELFNRPLPPLPFCFLLGILNSGVVYFFSFPVFGSTALSYLAMFAALLLEFTLFFRQSFWKNLFVPAPCLLHIAACHTSCCVLVAWIRDKTIFAAANNMIDTLSAAILCTNILSVAMLLFRTLISMSGVRIILQHDYQRRYITIWLVLSNLLLLYNTQIFRHEVDLPFIYGEQVIKCLILLTGAYIMLFYNLKVNGLMGYKEQSESLSAQLNTSVHFLESIVGDADNAYRINLTRGELYQGLSNNDSSAPLPSRPFYDAISELAPGRLFPGDTSAFYRFFDRERLLLEFTAGNRSQSLECRMRSDGNAAYRWTRLNVSLVEDEGTGDILALIYLTNIHEQRMTAQSLKKKAQQDQMTGLYNRVTFEAKVSNCLQTGRGILILVDVDNFKTINDSWGHQVGDEVLKGVANCLRRTFRKDDLVGRYGGDEFTVFVRDVPHVSSIEPHLERILRDVETLSRRLGLSRDGLPAVSVSMGVAATEKGLSLSRLFDCADQALYHRKAQGKSGYSIYQPGVLVSEPQK